MPNTTDIQEDFEFKPLTEGLGFQKKIIELRDDLQSLDSMESFSSMPTQTGILPKSKPQMNTSAATPSFSLQRPTINPQMTNSQMPQRQGPIQNQRPQTGATNVGPAWKPALQGATILEKSKVATTQTVGRLQPASSNWPAALFDSAMIAGMTLLFSAVVFALTKVEVSSLLETLATDFGVQMASLAIVFAVFEIYTVTCRTFFAKTLGEWVFDSRLGNYEDQAKLSYPFRVAFRTFLITITGFVVLPALSSAFGKDLAGSLSGVKLYSEIQ